VAADFDLLVLGDVNPDLVLYGGGVVPAFGQAEHLVEQAHMTVGGSGAILACGAAKLGLRVALCGVVGSDLFGRFMRESLEAAGVDTNGLVTDETVSTGITVVLSGPDDRAILTMPGTIAELRTEVIDPDLLGRARHVHVSSYYLQTALAPALPELFDRVRGAGGTTSLDPNWDPAERWDGDLADLLKKTDVFLPNAMEATRMAHTSSLEDAVRTLAARAASVVVKNGDHGATAGSKGELHHVAGLPMPVVDTTGAGDSFDAGFLAAWLGGESIERSLQIANACGALSTRAMGGVDAQATMEEALAAIDAGGAL
jgi:sugar/nucleoside kinase (ribokinase family)